MTLPLPTLQPSGLVRCPQVRRSDQEGSEHPPRFPRRFDSVASPANRLEVFFCIHLLSGPAQPLGLDLRDDVIDLLRRRHRAKLDAWLTQAGVTLHDPGANLLPGIVIATRLGRASPWVIPTTGFGLVLIAEPRWQARQCVAASMTAGLVRARGHYSSHPSAASPSQYTSRSIP